MPEEPGAAAAPAAATAEARAAAPAEARAAVWRRRLAIGLLLLAALAGLVALWQRAQPVQLPREQPDELSIKRPASAGTQVPCVSYAPFRREGHSPFVPGLRIEPHQIEADLRQLATITRCVRTYGVDNGLDAVPAIARRLGLRVVLGAWIGREAAANEDQLARALKLAGEFGDVIDLLVVGNEVLLRRELAPKALAELLARAKRASPVPVTYADVWEFWLRDGALLRPHVDRVAVHVLPYWEDHPVANAEAADHVHTIAARMRQAFAPLPVWVAETGWPAEGRQRGPARPGRAEQTRFVRELLAREAQAQPLRFNLIEGFDQPWKRRLEGAMGGYWGWFDAEGRARVQLQGPLPGDAGAQRALWAAGLGALLGVLLVGWGGRPTSRHVHVERGLPDSAGRTAQAGLRTPFAAKLLIGGLGGAALAACAVLQWHALEVWSRSPVEWVLSLALAAASAGWVGMTLPTLATVLADAWARPTRAAAREGAVAAWRRSAAGAQRWRAGLLLAVLFGTAMTALLLVFDGRYRPLLWPMGWVTSLVAAVLALLGERFDAQAREERLLAAVCAALAGGLLATEGLFNGQALATAASWLALAALAWPHRARPAANAGASPALPVPPTPAPHRH